MKTLDGTELTWIIPAVIINAIIIIIASYFSNERRKLREQIEKILKDKEQENEPS
jgi:predicted PurR-regulated permease PerM